MPADPIDVHAFAAVDMRVARVTAAPLSEDTRLPYRVLQLDLGPMGTCRSVAQFALIAENDLVERHVVAVINLGERQIGRYRSQALVLGTPHPETPAGQAQALPLFADPQARPGERIF